MTIAVLKKLCGAIPWSDPAVLEQTVELALEIAREGREGRRIGTLFTLARLKPYSPPRDRSFSILLR